MTELDLAIFLVKNWKPGVDMYIDVSVIDPSGQNWRASLLSGCAFEATRLKEIEKRENYFTQFNLVL